MDFRLERACYNVYHSDYILECILKYLDINEQVKLLDISERFAYVLSKFLWPKTCREINLYKTPYTNIISLHYDGPSGHRIRRSKVALNHNQCNEFLKLNAKNVKVLTVFSEYYFYEKEVGVSFKNVDFFKNLLDLCYYRLVLTHENMKTLSKKCKKLQKLHLLECYNEYLTPLVPGEDLNLQYIFEMQNLQELVIESDPLVETVLKPHVIRGIFLNMKLKKLILKNFTINDNVANINLLQINSLEILNFGFMSMRFWPSFLQYLQHFENLLELHINVSDCNTTLDIQVLDVLATKCKHLKNLSLEKCDLSVDDFGVLKSLKHLSLTACGGLTFANFQQILGGLKLITFSFINTRIFGTINHIYVSPTLEVIVIDTIRFTHISDAFQKSLNTFENLHTLKWLNGDINNNWIIEKCPKLKYLHIPNPYLLRRIVFTMKSLKELTFTSCKNLSWCLILILIRILTLERLCMLTNEPIIDGNEILYHACGIETTLKLIVIPIDIFEMRRSFWIDVLYLNENLKYSIYGKYYNIINGDFLEELLSDKRLCGRVKWWKFCGLKYAHHDLLNNFDECIHQLNKYTSHYRARNENITLEI